MKPFIGIDKKKKRMGCRERVLSMTNDKFRTVEREENQMVACDTMTISAHN